MPLLSIETNQRLDPATLEALLEDASRTLAEMLGKSERYVMLSLSHNPNMRLGGTAAPLAYVELKSLGLPQERTPEISRALAELLQRHTDVPPARVYIEFASPPPHCWGHDGTTF